MTKTLFFIICFLPTFLVFGTTNWELLVDKPDLKIYRGSSQKNNVFPVRADFESNFPVKDVLAVLLDAKRKTSWVPKLSKLEVLRKITKTKWVEYAEISVPWPCKNRDLIYEVDMKINEDFSQVIVHFQSVDNDEVINPENIRALIYPSEFIFSTSPENKNHSFIKTETFVDPRGDIPKWIVNLFQKSQSVKLARKLIKQLEKKYYGNLDPEIMRNGPFNISPK